MQRVAYEETVEERASVSGKSDTFTPEQATAESPLPNDTTNMDDDPYNDGTYEYDDTSADEDAAPTETETDNSSSSSLADEFDYCGEFELYGNGTCETICWEPDPDCENEPEPTCNTTWEDGFCDFGCEEVDPDCQDDVGEQAKPRFCLSGNGWRFAGVSAMTFKITWSNSQSRYASSLMSGMPNSQPASTPASTLSPRSIRFVEAESVDHYCDGGTTGASTSLPLLLAMRPYSFFLADTLTRSTTI